MSLRETVLMYEAEADVFVEVSGEFSVAAYFQQTVHTVRSNLRMVSL